MLPQQTTRKEAMKPRCNSFSCKTIQNLFIASIALMLCTTSHAQSLDKAKLDQFFDRLAEKNKAMGTLIITKNGATAYTRTIGYSSINNTERKPLTAATRYRIGSVTKMFTGAMIFQLIEEGKLQLSDTLARFFPQIPNAGKITISHLLAHRSGMPDVTDGSGRTNPRTQAQILSVIANGTPAFEPGAKYAYSNAGFVVLGYIIEKVTGKTYQQALQQRITSKIGLKDTYLGTGLVDSTKNESFSYRHIGDWKKEAETHLSNPGGAGGLISTPADLTRFIQALFDLKLVSKKSLDQMKQNQQGMEPFTYNSKTFYGHAGGIDNFGSWLVYEPEEKLTLAYTTNGKVYPVTKIIDGVFDIYYNKPFTIPTFELMEISTDVLDKYVGVYATAEAPVKFTIIREGSRLFVRMPNQEVAPLDPIAEDKFKIESLPLEFHFNAAKNEMTFIRNGNTRVFTKEK